MLLIKGRPISKITHGRSEIWDIRFGHLLSFAVEEIDNGLHRLVDGELFGLDRVVRVFFVECGPIVIQFFETLIPESDDTPQAGGRMPYALFNNGKRYLEKYDARNTTEMPHRIRFVYGTSAGREHMPVLIRSRGKYGLRFGLNELLVAEFLEDFLQFFAVHLFEYRVYVEKRVVEALGQMFPYITLPRPRHADKCDVHVPFKLSIYRDSRRGSSCR